MTALLPDSSLRPVLVGLLALLVAFMIPAGGAAAATAGHPSAGVQMRINAKNASASRTRVSVTTQAPLSGATHQRRYGLAGARS